MMLLPSFASPGTRLRSSTCARRVWMPAAAVQVPPPGPPFAVRVVLLLLAYNLPAIIVVTFPVAYLFSTLLTIARSVDRLNDGDQVYARRTLIGFVHHLVEGERAPRASEASLPEHRIRAFIDAHLADPELSPAQIAAACGISLRRLHRAFADTSWSVCGWIRHRRLEQCRQALLDPTQDRLSITQIAFRWGFNDAAHFSRSFRDAYEQTPRDARRRLNS